MAEVFIGKNLDFRTGIVAHQNSGNLKAASLNFCFKDNEELLLCYFTQFSVNVSCWQMSS